MKASICTFFLFISINIFGQFYPVSTIPNKLLKNANAVVRYEELRLKINSKKNAAIQIKKIVTVLNKQGEKLGVFSEYYDPLINIKLTNAEIYNSSGTLIKKIKQNKLKDYSAASSYSLYEDNRIKYFKPYVSVYPYTVVYEYTINYMGIMHLPSWKPILDYNLSIETSKIIIDNASSPFPRIKKINIDNNEKVVKHKNENFTTWTLSNYPALKYEPYSPSISNITPKLILAPSIYSYDGFIGQMNNWKELGLGWNQLLLNKDDLDETQKGIIKDLIKNETDTVQIIQRIYEYMQSKTRYVSIQEGIGGWQPFNASIVNEVGYGDCKALSNYMKSLLALVNIESIYTRVKAGNYEENIISDFSYNQFNHVILCVPLNKDTLWLECTNQHIPFGYLSKFTDDRDVLLIKESGGEIAHTTIYSQEQNKQLTNAEVKLNPDGSGLCEFSTSMKGLQYDNMSYLLYERPEDQKKALYNSIEIENISIENFSFDELRNRIPEITLNASLTLNGYASKIGSRLLVPINLLNKWTYIPKEVENRKTEVILKRAYHDIDTIIYTIPDAYEVEYLQKSDTIVSVFGTYIIQTSIENNKIQYIRDVKYNSGRFKPEEYESLRSFYKSISKADNAKFILKEKEI